MVLWPLLQAVIPDGFRNSLSNARSHVDLLINLSCISVVVSITSLIRAVLIVGSMVRCDSPDVCGDLPWAGAAWFGFASIIAALSARLTYLIAVEKAVTWGMYVRAAFDAFLPKLAEQIGYPQPSFPDLRRQYWTKISQQSLYHTQADLSQLKAPTQRPLLERLIDTLKK